MASCGAAKILIDLLSSPVDDIQSRASIILSDVACVGDNQTSIAQNGAIPPLVCDKKIDVLHGWHGITKQTNDLFSVWSIE